MIMPALTRKAKESSLYNRIESLFKLEFPEYEFFWKSADKKYYFQYREDEELRKVYDLLSGNGMDANTYVVYYYCPVEELQWTGSELKEYFGHIDAGRIPGLFYERSM